MLLIRRLPRKSRRRNRVQDPGLMWLRIAMVLSRGIGGGSPHSWSGREPFPSSAVLVPSWW